MEANRGFKKVAVEDGIIFERSRASPQKGAGPVPVLKRAVVHDGCSHSLLILSWEKCLRALDACIGILPAPVLPRLKGQSGRPRIDAPLMDGPAILVRFAPVETGALNPHDPIGKADRDDIIRYVCGIFLMVAERCNRVFK